MSYTINITASGSVFERDGRWYWIGCDGREYEAASEEDARAAVRVSEISDLLE